MNSKSKKEPVGVISETCSCAGTKLDRLLQPAILAILATESLNGYRVGKRLDAMTMFRDRKPDASGMYRTLRELEHRGLLVQIAAESGAPNAKVYRVTPLGAACLNRWVQTLTNYQSTLGDLLGHCALALSNIRAPAPESARATRTFCRCRN